jgi:serine/threonine-protein kinase
MKRDDEAPEPIYSGISTGVLSPSDALTLRTSKLTVPPRDDVNAPIARHLDRGEIARGGMASIRRAFDSYLLRDEAVKILDPALGASRHDAIGRFLQEAQITAQLDHASIVPVFDLGFDEAGSPHFFRMKLVQGRTLGALLDERTPPERSDRELEQLLRILVKVCEAVSFAHSRGVIHRDLKPENIMVGSHGQVYVMDWGCALVRPESPLRRNASLHIEETDTVVGTVAYMSPEQALARTSEIDARSDVFSIGALLYHLLSGQAPYRGINALSTLRLAQAGVIRPIEEAIPEAWLPSLRLPVGLCRIVSRAVSRQPAERHQTVDELREDLERFLRGGSWFTPRTFAAGTRIITDGDEAHAAYIITRGRCQAHRMEGSAQMLLREMGPGDVFGEAAIFSDQRRSASVTALTEVIAIEVGRAALEEELCMDSWTGAFVKALAARFRELDAQLGSLRGRASGQDFVRCVREHACIAGQPTGGDWMAVRWSTLCAVLLPMFVLTEAELVELVVKEPELRLELARDTLCLYSPGSGEAFALRPR